MSRAWFLSVALFGISCSIHASHGSRYPYPVRNAAFELERAVENLRREAEYAFHREGRDERRALNEVRKLESRARSFRNTVERRPADERGCRRDLEKVVKQYDRTERQLRHAYRSRLLYRDLERVRYLISRVHRYYGGHGSYPRPPYR